ncbi:hypothetical protein, partial [Chitinophaga pinensis]|uniref:hypothetical protein n=1 Tax=Chitinophaga pinensis TaxID=79329 RepID=UPI001C99F74D
CLFNCWSVRLYGQMLILRKLRPVPFTITEIEIGFLMWQFYHLLYTEADMRLFISAAKDSTDPSPTILPTAGCANTQSSIHCVEEMKTSA